MKHHVIWHDIECGNYTEDLGLWRELAAACGGPVLDVGAGTGRVALDLAQRGIEVVALDADPDLLAALKARAAGAGGLPVTAVCADARDFDLGRRFPLILVPMQTVQLLGGVEGRAAFLRAARAHLEPGGLVALALADALEAFDGETDGLPEPDVGVVLGVRYVSLPLAVVDEGDRAAIHRLRQILDPEAGGRSESTDVIRLDRVTPAQLAEEAEAAGLHAEEARRIAASEMYVGSTVLVLRG
jgi:SAM-dependent methyltransferase